MKDNQIKETQKINI